MEKKNNYALGVLLTLLGGIFWGFSGTCGQFLMQNCKMDTSFLVSVRLLVAGVILVVYGFILDTRDMLGVWKTPNKIVRLLVFAIFGLAFCQFTYLEAIRHTNAGTATVLQYTAPVMIMVYTCTLARRRPSKIEVLCVILALAGTFVIATHGNPSAMAITPAGLVWGLVSAVAMAAYSLLPVELTKHHSGITVSAWAMLIAGIVFLLAAQSWNKAPVLDASGIFALGGMCLFGTVLAYTMYLCGVQRVGAMQASMLASIEPVSATLFSLLWLKTPFMWVDIIGFACIFGTVFLLAKKKE